MGLSIGYCFDAQYNPPITDLFECISLCPTYGLGEILGGNTSARHVKTDRNYPGIDKDVHGGMTDIGRIIRDAWLFGILDENETCTGWSYQQINQLYDQVTQAWQPYGHLASNLPADLRTRHAEIQSHAIQLARDRGWDPELGDDD